MKKKVFKKIKYFIYNKNYFKTKNIIQLLIILLLFYQLYHTYENLIFLRKIIHPFVYGDWFTNYQGGFIRRGLMGEIFYQISILSKIKLDKIVFSVQIISYLTMFIFSSILILNNKNFINYIPLIASPLIYYFPVLDPNAGGRKEILYFAILTITIFLSKLKNKTFFNRYFIFISFFIFPTLILTHELVFFYLPYIFIIFKFNQKERNLYKILLLFIPSVVSFVLCAVVFNKLSIENVSRIFDSINRLGYSIDKNFSSISFLSYTVNEGQQFTFSKMAENKYYLYLISFLLSLLGFITIYDLVIKLIKDRYFVYFTFLSMIFSIPLFIIAADWGRWIYIHIYSFFMLTFLIDSTNDNLIDKLKFLKFTKNPFFIIFFTLFYSLTWYVPHYGYPSPFQFSKTAIYKFYLDIDYLLKLIN